MDESLDERLPFTLTELRTAFKGKVLERLVGVEVIKPPIHSHHATLYFLNVAYKSGKGIKEEQVVAKVFHLPSGGSDTEELHYLQEKNPHLLHGAQQSAETKIWENIGGGLIAKPWGSLGQRPAIFNRYIPGISLHDALIELHNQIYQGEIDFDRKKEVLLNAVRNLARFNGRCNALPDAFDRKHYEDQNRLHQALSKTLLRSYFTRSYFAENSSEFGPNPEYGFEKVEKFINDKQLTHFPDSDKEEKGATLSERVTKIAEKRRGLNERTWFSQGEYNPAHLIYEGKESPEEIESDSSNIVVDNEKFGYETWGRDIATLFIGGVDNISMPENGDLPFYLAKYLAWKDAFERQKLTGDQERIQQVDQLKSFTEAANYLINEGIASSSDYAEFVFSFLANSIEEGIHLHATYQRYTPEHLETLVAEMDGYRVDNLKQSKRQSVKQLFGTVTELGWLMSHCRDNDEVRDYFYLLGSLATDLGIIDIDQNILRQIKSGGFSQTAYDFYQKVGSNGGNVPSY